jgi:hypothetical protein
MTEPKAYCTQLSDRECVEGNCCLEERMSWFGKDGKIYFSEKEREWKKAISSNDFRELNKNI